MYLLCARRLDECFRDRARV